MMTNEDIVNMARRGEQAALLLGQVSGQVHLIMNACECVNTKDKLEVLFTHIIHTVGEIFYKPHLPKEPANEPQEDIHGRGTEEPTQIL